MAEMFRKAVLAALVLAMAVLGSQTKAVSGSESILCNMTEEGLTACKPSVTTPNPVTPSTDCCSALSTADLGCLCSYRNSLLLPSLGIDPDLCMQLPPKCNLNMPPQC